VLNQRSYDGNHFRAPFYIAVLADNDLKNKGSPKGNASGASPAAKENAPEEHIPRRAANVVHPNYCAA
jgi:hypothetical protein